MPDPEYRPTQPSLTGSRLKLKRAKQHLDELEPEIRAYNQGDPYRIADEPDIEGEWIVVRFAEVREQPNPMWGVRVGEFLHDLRSALDNLVWELVVVNGQEPGDHNQFPIYWDAERPPGPARLKALRGIDGKTRLDDMLFGVHRDHVATIKSLQPYLGLDEQRDAKIALGSVAFLNNIDKHKFVHPTLGFSQPGDDSEVVEHVSGLPPDQVEVHYTLGPIYPGAEAFRWRVVGGTRETKVTMQGKIPYDIAFGHQNTTLSHLDWAHEQIGEVVGHFASAFPTDPGDL